MGKNHRPDRLGGEIKKTIGQVLIREVKDPRLTENLVSISDVDVTNDGSYAFCYVNVFYTTKEMEEIQYIKKQVLAGLNSAKGLFKREISKAVKVRRIPELIFKMDEAAEYGRHIDELLSTIDFNSYQGIDPKEVEDEK